MEPIHSFRGDYYFPSNFSYYPVTYNGKTYSNSEAAFQAQKTLSEDVQWKFTRLTPRDARTEGRKVTLRPDWEEVKDDIMRNILQSKFSNPVLARQLLNTGDSILEETNKWHDNYWGNCTCDKCRQIPGQNKLGTMLMELREELMEVHELDTQRVPRL